MWLSVLVHEMQSVIADGDQPLAVEIADGALEDLLAHLKTGFDILGIALVAKVAVAVMLLEIVEQGGSEVEGVAAAGGL